MTLEGYARVFCTYVHIQIIFLRMTLGLGYDNDQAYQVACLPGADNGAPPHIVGDDYLRYGMHIQLDVVNSK